jgi:hypothetical protein
MKPEPRDPRPDAAPGKIELGGSPPPWLAALVFILIVAALLMPRAFVRWMWGGP